MSNVTGGCLICERLPLLIQLVMVMVDGAQGAVHFPQMFSNWISISMLSGHKLYGPTGIGVLYGKSELLEGCRPRWVAANDSTK